MKSFLFVTVLVSTPALFAQEAVPPSVTPAALQAHYNAVVGEMAVADTSQLEPAQIARRHSLLRELDAYLRRADFGRSPGGDRINLFRDADGRLCAVGNLMHVTGHDDLIERIAAGCNESFVLELTDVPGVAEWLAETGISAAEAARIQGPSMPGSVTPSSGPSESSSAASNASSSDTGSASTGAAGSSRRSGPSTGTSAPAGASTGRGELRRSRDPGPGREFEVSTGAPTIEPWWTWWELNKSTFLPPQRMRVSAPAASPYSVSIASDVHDRLIEDLRPRLLACLADRDATVRAAAALTHGRLSGADAVPDLLPLLADPSASVRDAALLALGATGSMKAVHDLLGVAEDGLYEGREISADARPLAMLALGVARRRGVPDQVDTFLAERARDTGEEGRAAQDVREAALIALDLARSPLVAEDMDALLSGKRDGAALTCRRLEALGRTGDPSHVPALLHETGSRDLERRRAAAVALAGFDDPLLSSALMTACEVETEPMVRGFLLLTLGEQSDLPVRDFLVRTLEKGPAESHAWAALALGLQARRDGNETARAALRDGLHDAGEEQGAWVLACGLARDPQALAPLAGLLTEASNPRVRMFAALSLGMIGGEAAMKALRERFSIETSPLARVGIAQALGVQGQAEDVPALLGEVRSMSSPQLAAQFAAAVGFHGSAQAAAGLTALLADAGTSAPTRAAALDGLALLLDRGEPLLVAQSGCHRNFMQLSDWLVEALPISTL